MKTVKASGVRRQQQPRNIGLQVCSYCSRRFNTQLSLKVHERVHTGAKPFHCEVFILLPGILLVWLFLLPLSLSVVILPIERWKETASC